jgi:hypothetical protein
MQIDKSLRANLKFRGFSRLLKVGGGPKNF